MADACDDPIDESEFDRVHEWLSGLLEESEFGEVLRQIESSDAFSPRTFSGALVEEVNARLRVNPRQAFWLAFVTQRVAARHGRNEEAAKLWYQCGLALSALRRVKGALRFLDRALERFLALGMIQQAARAQVRRMFVLSQLERPDEMVGAADQAVRLFKQCDDKSGLGEVFFSLGVAESRLDRFRPALDHYARARLALEVAEGKEKHLATLDANVARCLEGLYRFRAAKRYFERARKVFADAGDRQFVAQLDYNRAYFAFLRGRYVEAIQLYAAAEAVFRELDDRQNLGLVNVDRAELYLVMGMPADARVMARRALGDIEKGGLPKERGQAHFYIAVAELLEGSLEGAEAACRAARELFESQGYDAWVAECDLHLARCAFKRRDFELATELLEQVDRVFSAMDRSARAIAAGLLAARVALEDDEPLRALEALADAEERVRRIDAPWLELELYRLMGLAYLAARDTGAAVHRLEQAVGVLEQRRGNIPPDEFMAAFLSSKAAVYAETIDALIQAKSAGRAFEYCGRAKSRALVDMLSARDDQHLHSSKRLDDVRLQRLRDEMNALYARLHGIGASEDAERTQHGEDLHRALETKEAEFSRLLRDARARDPEFASLNSVDSLGLERVQALLDDRTTLLEYFVTPTRLYVFVVRRDAFAAHEVAVTSRELEQRAQKFRFHLAPFHSGLELSPRRAELQLEATRANLAALHRVLIAPVRRELTTQRLIVVPHGTLHGVPFHALADGDGWLCERFDISYVPSAAVYEYCKGRVVKADGPPTVLAVPDEAAPLIEEEARSVAAALANGTICVLGKGVTPERVREAAATSRVLHIATHAMFRYDHPMLSSIRLADGTWLNLYDVYDLDIAAELVVLSACETGVSRVTQGDEVMGLSRGFLYAGAPRLLTSQWRVADDATSQFMQLFYGSRRDGRSYGASLRNAMAGVRSEHPHPYHWAPFFLVGDPDASGPPPGDGRGGDGRAEDCLPAHGETR